MSGFNYLVILDKSIIHRKDLSPFTRIITRAECSNVALYKHTITAQVDGYNKDSRELYEIPEVVEYFRLLITEHPEVFYFLNKNSWLIVFLCSCVDIVTVGADNGGSKQVGFRFNQDRVSALVKGNCFYEHITTKQELKSHIDEIEAFILSAQRFK